MSCPLAYRQRGAIAEGKLAVDVLREGDTRASIDSLGFLQLF